MAPAVTFTDPGKVFSIGQPMHFAMNVDPGFVFFADHRLDGTTRGIGQKDLIAILRPIKLLDQQLLQQVGLPPVFEATLLPVVLVLAEQQL